jgi:hypothetical protein
MAARNPNRLIKYRKMKYFSETAPTMEVPERELFYI